MKYIVKISEKLQEILGRNPPLSVTVVADDCGFETDGFMASNKSVAKIPVGRTLEQEIARLIIDWAISSDLDLDEQSVQKEIVLIPSI